MRLKITKIILLLPIVLLLIGLSPAQDDTNINTKVCDFEIDRENKENGKKQIQQAIEFLKIEFDKEENRNNIAIEECSSKLEHFKEDAIPDLINALKASNNSGFLGKLTFIFKDIGEVAVPKLISTLRETPKTPENKDVLRYTANSLKHIFGNTPGIKESLKQEAVPLLEDVLKSKKGREAQEMEKGYFDDYDAAADCLEAIKEDAKDAVPLLIELLTYEKYRKGDFYRKSNAIEVIIIELIKQKDFTANDKIINAFETYKNQIAPTQANTLEKLIEQLKNGKIEQERLQSKELTKNLSLLLILSVIILLISLIPYIYWAKPIWLVRFHEYLWTNSLIITFKKIVEFQTIPFISLICLRPYALDAWIKSNLEKAKGNFEAKETINEHSLYIPVKVSFRGNKKTDFKAENFREVFEKNQVQLLIYGDGGSGKTNLACQFARWAISGSLFEKHLAFPVFLEENFENLQTEIKNKIKELLMCKKNNKAKLNTISDALQKELLKTKRVVLIVDGISEHDEKNKRQIRDNTDINAVIYTSRNNEIKDIAKVETNNLIGGMVTDFLSDYIEKSIGEAEKEKLFGNTIFDYNSGDLKKLAGEKEISILMAKLYAEQMIAQKQGTISNDLPNSIPELMIQSIKILHKKTPSEDLDFSDVIKVAKIIAYESLNKDYRPIPASKNDVEKELENVENYKKILKHLQDKLKVIETKGIEDDKFAFKIDPLAEYLAASCMVEKNSGDKTKWKNSLKDIQKKSKINNIKGFLGAVMDYCEINKGVPKSVSEELRIILGN